MTRLGGSLYSSELYGAPAWHESVCLLPSIVSARRPDLSTSDRTYREEAVQFLDSAIFIRAIREIGENNRDIKTSRDGKIFVTEKRAFDSSLAVAAA